MGSSYLSRDALGSLHNQIPACTGKQPVSDAIPYGFPQDHVLREMSCGLFFCLLFGHFPLEIDNGLQNLGLCFLFGKQPSFSSLSPFLALFH